MFLFVFVFIWPARFNNLLVDQCFQREELCDSKPCSQNLWGDIGSGYDCTTWFLSVDFPKMTYVDLPQSPSSPNYSAVLLWCGRFSCKRHPIARSPLGTDMGCFNTLCANFFRASKTIFLRFMSFLKLDMTQVVEILLHVRQEHFYSIMGADVSATQEAKASATVIFTMLNRINYSQCVKG